MLVLENGALQSEKAGNFALVELSGDRCRGASPAVWFVLLGLQGFRR